MGGEDFWAGEESLKGFHVLGRGSLFSSNPLAEIPALFFRNPYTTCLQAACPSLWIHSLFSRGMSELDSPNTTFCTVTSQGYNVASCRRPLRPREAK